MPTMFCQRTPADQVDYANERFVVCKASGVTAGGRKFELGDELPSGILPPRAMREIYDTPLRLVETMDYAMADEELLKFMMARMSLVEDGDEDDRDADGDVKPASAAIAHTSPNANNKRKRK